jgi:hypothetical protein
MNRNALRTRLRDINIEHTRLLRDKLVHDHVSRMAALRSERAILLGLLAGDPALRLVANQDPIAPGHRHST